MTFVLVLALAGAHTLRLLKAALEEQKKKACGETSPICHMASSHGITSPIAIVSSSGALQAQPCKTNIYQSATGKPSHQRVAAPLCLHACQWTSASSVSRNHHNKNPRGKYFLVAKQPGMAPPLPPVKVQSVKSWCGPRASGIDN